MTSSKCLNSGVASNGAAFILSPLGYGVSFRVPGVFEEEVALSIFQSYSGKFLLSYSGTDNLFQDTGKTLRIRCRRLL